MSISKAKILGSFIEYPLPENQITKEALNLSELLLSKEYNRKIRNIKSIYSINK